MTASTNSQVSRRGVFGVAGAELMAASASSTTAAVAAPSRTGKTIVSKDHLRLGNLEAHADRAGVADGAEAVDRVDPGTTQMAHMTDTAGAANVRFSAADVTELNTPVRALDVQGQRLPDAVLAFSGVEAPDVLR